MEQRWKRIRKVSDDLFVAPSYRSLLIYRQGGNPVRVKLFEVEPLIDALVAAADDLTSGKMPGPNIPRLDS